MKITLEQHGVKYSIETNVDSHTASEVIDHMCQLVLCAGYHPESVQHAVCILAEEYENDCE